MQQLFQSLATGGDLVAVPKCLSYLLLIRTSCSLVSAGTERMLVEFGIATDRQGLPTARQSSTSNPKSRVDGLLTTFEAVQSKSSAHIAWLLQCGHCSAVGADVSGFQVGDRGFQWSPCRAGSRSPASGCRYPRSRE